MGSSDPPDEEGTTIATFLSLYLAARQRMAQRFADRQDIFPTHILSPFSVVAYSCKDGVIIDFLEPADETTLRFVREETRAVGEVLAAITFGFVGLAYEKGLPDLSYARPRFRITTLSLQNKGTGVEQPEVRRWYARMLIDRDAPGDRAKARELLTEAIAMYRRIGMPKHVEMAEALLGQTGSAA